MGNVLSVFFRDVKRLFKTPQALLVALFLVVLPSLYTWFNVVGFWNPYDNTGNLQVCVVNEDAGAYDDTLGQLDLGDQVIDNLEGDNRLKWSFVDRNTAMDEVEGGRAYAAFIIPESFSSDVATIITGDFQQPRIEYYVNEKAGPVAPKIMDTGANQLETTINGTFVSTVASTVADALDQHIAGVRNTVEQANARAIARIDDTHGALDRARASISDLSDTASQASGKTGEAKASLAEAKGHATRLSDDLGRASGLIGDANSDIVKASTSLASALDRGSQLVSKTTGKANLAAGKTQAGLSAAQGEVEAALEKGRAATREADQAIDAMESLSDALPAGELKNEVDRALSSAEAAQAEAESVLSDLESNSAALNDATTDMAQAADKLDTATQQALDTIDDYRSTISDSSIPAVSEGLAALSAASGSLNASTATQASLIDRASTALGQLQSTLNLAADALGNTDNTLSAMQGELDDLRTDIVALGSSDDVSRFLDGGDVDSAKVAEFMQSPTTVQTEELYPMNAYGSAMAPLFMNLTLWIGVFMLLVIMRIEVDDENIENLTATQRFFGRALLLGVMCVLQAVVCCTGCIIIGMQVQNVPALYITAIVASLAYLSIQYTLAAIFQHVGKAMCVILVFVQIPAATGLYPIEMTPEFFQVVYPLFPFTYGINAMRETVFGFYGNIWISCLGVLVAYAAAFMAVGALGRPYTANINRLFARQIEQSDIINIERMELPERHYRIAQLIEALLDRDDYRAELEERALRFMSLYPKLRMGALVVGIVLPVIFTLAFAITDTDKVIMLTVWLVWVALIIAFFLTVEYLRDRMAHQLSLNDLSDDEVGELYARRLGGPATQSRAASGPGETATADDGGGKAGEAR